MSFASCDSTCRSAIPNSMPLTPCLDFYCSLTPRGSTAFSPGESNGRAGGCPWSSHGRGRVWLGRPLVGGGGGAGLHPGICGVLCCFRPTFVCGDSALCRDRC